MRRSRHAIEIFLQPGEIYFGDRNTRIRTVLGSCVAATFWHPRQKIGGMCHYMLGKRPGRQSCEEINGAVDGALDGVLNGKYADEALRLLLREIDSVGGNPREYEVKLFGGGNMFVQRKTGANRSINVADDNVVAGRELLARYGFAILAEHLGGHGHRQVIFEVSTGDVWVRKHRVMEIKRAGSDNELDAEAR
jgi:chemotaxis protein CheD